MPILGPNSALPGRPARVLVAGTSGSGKTTLARQVASTLKVRHTEIDALFHGPRWVPRPTFEADVEELVRQPSWVVEWQYASVRPLLAARADLLVWVDPPWPVTMGQVTARTVRRRVSRQPLWNGNLEPPLWTFFTDPDHIVRWAWSTRGATAPRVHDLRELRPELPVVRLRSRRERRSWVIGPLSAVVR